MFIGNLHYDIIDYNNHNLQIIFFMKDHCLRRVLAQRPKPEKSS